MCKAVTMIGIENLGNTCCVNTLMQCLFHVATLRKWILQNNKVQDSFVEQVKEMFELMAQDQNPNEEIMIKPLNFIKTLMHSSNGMFRHGQQHDICELYHWMIDFLHEKSSYQFKIQKHVKGVFRAVWETRETLQNGKHSDVYDMFQGIHINMVQCSRCEEHTSNIEPYMSWHVDIPKSNEVVDLGPLLMNQYRQETLAEWKCDKCSSVGGNRLARIFTTPTILVIVLKRFDNDMSKNSTRVKIAEFIEFAPTAVMVRSDIHLKYRLCSIGNHYGSYHGGHYNAIVRQDHGWTLWDDADCSTIEKIDDVLQENSVGYMLFYERMDSKS